MKQRNSKSIGPHKGRHSTLSTKTTQHKSTNYISPNQAASLLNVYHDKILTMMKRSTLIYGMLQKYEMDVGTVSSVLFTNRLFKANILNQPESVINNSKKFEQFLLIRIEKILTEMKINQLLDSNILTNHRKDE